MPPKKHPKVDYLRVYPGLNDFSDALEAIPLDMIPYFTRLKDVDAKYNDIAPQLGSTIDAFFKTRETALLPEVSNLLLGLMPAVERKMHLALLGSEVMLRQVERLTTDYQMACEHEIPQEIQLDPNDQAFMQVVPPEKQTTARSQARREAREAREARRVAQQESRSGTPLNGNADSGASLAVPQVSSRRRERTGTPQSPQLVSQQVAHPAAVGAPSPVQAPPPVQPVPAAAAVPQPVQPVRHEPRHEGRQLRRHTTEEAADEDASSKQEPRNAVPPVVMPIAQTVESAMNAKNNGDDDVDIETAAAEAVSGLKRKRGASPKDNRNEPTYCYCQQGSYGEMVACDGPSCRREWFHLGCLGLSALPKGQWFCEECQAKFRRR